MHFPRYERTWCQLAALVLAVSAAGGCVDERLVAPNTGLLPAQRPYLYTDQDWVAVLGTYVKEGLVHYEGLSHSREPLERYYALLSVTGPQRTPEQFVSRAQQTAYWLNAYNALVLCAVMDQYPVSTMYDLSLRRLEHEYRFSIDGKVLTLADIEAKMLESSDGDVRALLATSRAAVGTPPLPAEPFRAETLDRQLAEAARNALDRPNILRVDHEGRSILIWQLILRRQGEFEEFWRKRRRVRTAFVFNVLLELASPEQRRALQGAVGYAIRPMPFDRTLNRWPPRGDAPPVP